MLARMKGTVARYEVEQSSRRLRRKHAEMAAAGRHNGPRPFGWDVVTPEPGASVLRINKAEAAVVRECVARVLAGESLWRIAREVYGHGPAYGIIFEANRRQIDSPHLIYPGQVFRLPSSSGQPQVPAERR